LCRFFWGKRPWQIRLEKRVDAPSLTQLNPALKDCVMRQMNSYAALQRDMKLSKLICLVFGIGLRARRQHPHQIMRVGVIELIARALVQHIRVDPVGAEQ
jgi:hypothetical protein